jgi:hypothetical protein
MHEYPAEILIIFLKAMIELLDIRPGEEAQNRFLQLAASFAGNDLDKVYFFRNGIAYNAIQLSIDSPAVAENIMKIKFYSCHCTSRFYGLLFDQIIPYIIPVDELPGLDADGRCT